jgi:hypothetical protein
LASKAWHARPELRHTSSEGKTLLLIAKTRQP